MDRRRSPPTKMKPNADNFTSHSICRLHGHCDRCRSTGPEGPDFRDTFGAPPLGPENCPDHFPDDWKRGDPVPYGVVVKIQPRPRVAVSQLVTFVMAAASGKHVSLGIMRERREVCLKCDHLRMTESGEEWCHACGCTINDSIKLTNLAAYEENLPLWGCKHPERNKGKGWKR